MKLLVLFYFIQLEELSVFLSQVTNLGREAADKLLSIADPLR